MRYTVKVRAVQDTTKNYLWGGDEIESGAKSASPLFLTFRVDEMGEKIEFGTAIGKSTTLKGKLKPGETFSISLSEITGIYATCIPGRIDTKVECSIEGLAVSS
jgi:hypothetical protein